jgi:hypothetical protein
MSANANVSKRRKIVEVYNRGRKRFLLIQGVLLYGVSSFIMFTLIQHCRVRSTGVQFTPVTGGELLVNLCVWLLAGYLFGLLGWRRIKKLYVVQTEQL